MNSPTYSFLQNFFGSPGRIGMGLEAENEIRLILTAF